MKLTQEDLLKISEVAIEAAKQAGQMIAEYATREVTVNKKATGDTLASQVVTEVDLMSQEIILKVLEPACKKYDLAVLTEETPDDFSRFEKDYFWSIDPLDGTLSFIESKHGYAVSIGLVAKNGEPQIGVIFDPMKQTLYYAVKGQGAFINNERWEHPGDDKQQKLTYICDRSFNDHQLHDQMVDELQKLTEELGYSGLELFIQGGAAMNGVWMMEKQPSVYFKFPKPKLSGGSSWDYAASSCILKEAGIWATNIFGKPIDLNRKDSAYMNHEGIVFGSTTVLAEGAMKIYEKLKDANLK